MSLDAVPAEFDDHVVRIIVSVGLQDGMNELSRFLGRNLIRLDLVGQRDREDPVGDDRRNGKRSAPEHPEQRFIVHAFSDLRQQDPRLYSRDAAWSATPGVRSQPPSRNTASRAFKRVRTFASVEDSPISPIRHTLPFKGPSPPPISIPYSDSSRAR